MQAWKIAPAIAMGCTMVMKLSEKTPLSGLMMCHLFVEAGIPAGVLNMVNGYGDPTGSLIARHMDIKKVAFTGSSAVGHKIVAMAAESNLKKVTLELGGKSAMIICKDADLDEAAINCHVGLFINMGQCCCASSRILIHEDVHDAFVAKPSTLTIEPGEVGQFQLDYTPPGPSSDPNHLILDTNDPDPYQSPVELQLYAANTGGLQVGDRLTSSFDFLDLAGGDVNNLEGNVIVLAYFALF